MNKNLKVFKSPEYNLLFDTQTGFMARWGKTKEEDPVMCPVGPEIADIEISTVCNGIGTSMEKRVPCGWCYKSNTGVGENMSVETFAQVFYNFPKILTQIAFGIGDIDGNPDLLPILAFTRSNGVVPNLTTNGMGIDEKWARRLATLCGAVAVSHYHIDDVCFDAVERLTNAGLKQVNIHKLLSEETYQDCFNLIDRVAKDKKCEGKLSKLKAIVFLLLKPKGDRNRLHGIASDAQYKALIDYARVKNVAIGMDSCSAPMVLRNVEKEVIPSIEPCESTLFSIYVSVKGEVFPCSFTEGTPGWETGISLTAPGDFLKDVWNGERLTKWRNTLLGSSSGCNDCAVQSHCRSCPVYEVTPCREVPSANGLVGIGAR
jgi:radical SAM protein with 4Fe4S-binding SPASM domain